MNIITIIIDTLRYDYVGINGNQEIKTPNLDKLASKSWNFHRAFAASFPTIPHRTDVFTGCYGAPFHSWKPLDCDVPTIPGILAQEKGYCTQLIHDTPHLVNGGHRFDYPFHAWTPVRGAEVDRAWITDTWEFLNNWKYDSLFDIYPRDRQKLLRDQNNIASYCHTNKGRQKEEDWNVARLFKKASQFLEDNNNRDNFFLWIDCFDPHEPWDSPPEFVKMYDQTPEYEGKIDPRAFRIRNNPNLSDAARQRIKAMYAAKVTFMDKWLGVFLDTLETTGLEQKTAILLTADHGTNVGDGSQEHPFGKFTPVTENEAHVPLMIYLPNSEHGTSNILVQPQDIFFTLMNLVNVSTPQRIRSKSFDILKQVRNEIKEKRKIALSGSHVGNWSGENEEKVLFSVFNKNWRLGFTLKPEYCQLQKLGSQENLTANRPGIVKNLRSKAITELEKRNLDSALLKWLKNEGEVEFPDSYTITDAHSAPPGWRTYFQNLYKGE